jgi:hypothetical protein
VLLTWLILLVVSLPLALAWRRLFQESDRWLCWAAGTTATSLGWIGLTLLLRHPLGFPVGWKAAVVLMGAVSGLAFKFSPSPSPQQDLPKDGLAKIWWLLPLVLATYLVVHTREMLLPEDDFWIHFPVISLLGRGTIPPVNPFLPDLQLFGHFGRDLLLAILSQFSGDIISSTWALNHATQFLSLVFAWRLGLRWSGPKGAVLLPWFLFCGLSCGSRVGLIDTYDNNNGLVYASVLFFLYLFEQARRPWHWLAGGFWLGCFCIVYETHALLLIVMLGLWTLLRIRLSNNQESQPWYAPLSCIVVALLVGASLGGPIQDLAMRILGLRKAQLGHSQVYEGQRVSVAFPKQKFLQIDLGSESYRRRSYVLQMPLFEDRLPALDSGGYTSIFHPKVLAIHWIPTWLGLFSGFWFIARHRKGHGLNRIALSFWLFGWLSYLVPAVVDFGALHEKEYFRWEFGATFGFAGSFGLLLADSNWSSKPAKIGLGLLAVLCLWGGEKRINESIIEIQRSHRLPGSPLRSQHMHSPLYPNSQEWLLSHQQFNLNASEIELAKQLYAQLGPDAKVVTDIDARDHASLTKESVLAGLIGAPILGHQAPPRWMPDGIAPYFHTPNWSVFWQQQEPRAWPALGANCVFSCAKDSPEPSQWKGMPKALGHLGKSGQPQAWLFERLPSSAPATAPDELEIELTPIDPQLLAQPEISVGWNWIVHNRSAKSLKYNGPLQLVMRGKPEDPASSLTLGVAIEVAPESTQTIKGYLVPPLHKGPSTAELLCGERQLASYANPQQSPISPFEAWLDTLQLSLESPKVVGPSGSISGKISWPGASPKQLAGPAKIGYRCYLLKEQRYQTPFGFDGEVQLEKIKDPHSFVLPVQAKHLEPDIRLDYFFRSYSGFEKQLKPYLPR